MFIEMKKQVLNFGIGKAELWFRYDIQALYNIENSGFDPFDIFKQRDNPKAVRCFLENGLADWYKGVDDNNSLDEYVNRLMSMEGFQTELIAYIQAAIMLSLPNQRGSSKEKREKFSILSLMTACVDVMRMPMSEFMGSTIREASDRWERYAVAMGYRKPVETFKEFDDE